MTPDAPTRREQALADWLRACDEAFAAGGPATAPPPADLDPDDPAWRDALACLRLLDQLRPRATERADAGPDGLESPVRSDPEADRFLGAVRASGVVDPGALVGWTRSQRSDATIPSDELASRLVRDGLLTRYQADRFLSGDAGGLVIGGRYRVLDRLGAGGMGEVYLAEHAVMRHRVAVKVLPPGRSAEALAWFHREARAVAALDHPHIVRAYDVDSDGPTHYLVMEYVGGRTLHDVVRTDGPLDVRAAAGYAAQVAAALQHAHERGLVHRDVKPANLVVDPAGTVKVLDLGLARFLRGDGAEPRALVGTADYMAPEQSVDGPGGDARADIYSLGCTLYFLLAGKAPFGDKPVAKKLLCHQLAEPEPLRSVRPDVPAGLAAVVDRMTAKAPADRYQTAAEVVAALRPWAEGSIPHPVPTRKPRRVRAAVAAGLLLAVGTTAAVWSLGPKPDGTPVSGPYPDGHLEAVTARLRELNPRFDGNLGGMAYRMVDDEWVVSTLRIDGGRVTHLSLSTDRVSDITPLGDLRSLTHLMIRDYPANGNDGLVTDLGPLRGLPIKALECSGNARLRDLGPLRGMPLEELAIGGTAVDDLSPLRGMPLRKVFCGGSKVTDLSPLAGAPLTALSVRFTSVSDLGPVRGAPLEVLRCEGSQIRDLSPVAGSRLRVLNCKGTPVRSLVPLAGTPLEDLHFDYDPVRDADLPQVLPQLKWINGSPATDFWATVAKSSNP